MTGPAVAELRVVAMIDTPTLVAHLVTDEAVAAGRRAGRYVGLCGAVVLPGSLQEDTGRSCPAAAWGGSSWWLIVPIS